MSEEKLEEKVQDEEHANEGVKVEGETLTEEEKAQKREETKKAILEQIKKKVINESGMSKEDAEIALEMLDEANMPVKITDEEFQLGARELDIRNLDQKNLNQMFFRMLVLQGVYLRNISKSLNDIINLIFVELDTLGVENIVKASDKVILKVAKQNEKLEKENNKKSN